MVASRRWHKMNNTICEIERSTEKIFQAKHHCACHKNSIVKEKIPILEAEKERLHLDLERQCEEWKDSLGVKLNEKGDKKNQ